MTELRRLYRITEAPDGQLRAAELNRILAMIGDRLDQLEGYRGTPTFLSSPNLRGNKITNAGSAVDGTDVPNYAQVSSIDGRVTTLEAEVIALDSRMDAAETDIAQDEDDIDNLDTRLTTAESNILYNDQKAYELEYYKFAATEFMPGTAEAWDDISFNFLAAQSVGAGVPSLTNINSSGRWGYAYTNEAALANEKRQTWGVQAGHGIKTNSELRFHVHIYTGARVPAVDEYVRLELTYAVTNINSVLSPTTVTADCLIPAGTAAYTHKVLSIATVTGTGVKYSADIGGELRRKSSVASDTYEDTVYMIFGDPHAKFNKRGTFYEIPGVTTT